MTNLLDDQFAFCFAVGRNFPIGAGPGEEIDTGDPLVDGAVPFFQRAFAGEDGAGEEVGGLFGGGRIQGPGREGQVAEDDFAPGDGAFGGGIPLDGGALGEVAGV